MSNIYDKPDRPDEPVVIDSVSDGSVTSAEQQRNPELDFSSATLLVKEPGVTFTLEVYKTDVGYDREQEKQTAEGIYDDFGNGEKVADAVKVLELTETVQQTGEWTPGEWSPQNANVDSGFKDKSFHQGNDVYQLSMGGEVIHTVVETTNGYGDAVSPNNDEFNFSNKDVIKGVWNPYDFINVSDLEQNNINLDEDTATVQVAFNADYSSDVVYDGLPIREGEDIHFEFHIEGNDYTMYKPEVISVEAGSVTVIEFDVDHSGVGPEPWGDNTYYQRGGGYDSNSELIEPVVSDADNPPQFEKPVMDPWVWFEGMDIFREADRQEIAGRPILDGPEVNVSWWDTNLDEDDKPPATGISSVVEAWTTSGEFIDLWAGNPNIADLKPCKPFSPSEPNYVNDDGNELIIPECQYDVGQIILNGVYPRRKVQGSGLGYPADKLSFTGVNYDAIGNYGARFNFSVSYGNGPGTQSIWFEVEVDGRTYHYFSYANPDETRVTIRNLFGFNPFEKEVTVRLYHGTPGGKGELIESKTVGPKTRGDGGNGGAEKDVVDGLSITNVRLNKLAVDMYEFITEVTADSFVPANTAITLDHNLSVVDGRTLNFSKGFTITGGEVKEFVVTKNSRFFTENVFGNINGLHNGEKFGEGDLEVFGEGLVDPDFVNVKNAGVNTNENKATVQFDVGLKETAPIGAGIVESKIPWIIKLDNIDVASGSEIIVDRGMYNTVEKTIDIPPEESTITIEVSGITKTFSVMGVGDGEDDNNTQPPDDGDDDTQPPDDGDDDTQPPDDGDDDTQPPDDGGGETQPPDGGETQPPDGGDELDEDGGGSILPWLAGGIGGLYLLTDDNEEDN